MISLRRRIVCVIVFLLWGFVSAKTQSQSCSLKSSQFPGAAELFGFQLGLTAEEAKAKVPLIMFGHPDQLGLIKTSINPSYGPRFDQAAFLGVRTISLDFLDGRLVTLWIGYDERFKWQTVEEFVSGISKSLNLPTAWTAKRGGKELTCDGFSIFISMIAGSPSIRITDQAAQDLIASRREAAAAAAEAAVVGDRNTRLYYPSDCEAADAIIELNRVRFKDKDEAEKAGYKLAKDCQ